MVVLVFSGRVDLGYWAMNPTKFDSVSHVFTVYKKSLGEIVLSFGIWGQQYVDDS